MTIPKIKRSVFIFSLINLVRALTIIYKEEALFLIAITIPITIKKPDFPAFLIINKSKH
jgi:hypothetical protein